MNQVVGPVLSPWPKDKVHADMPKSAGNFRPACSNPCRGSHPCHQNEAGQGPNCFRPLTDRYDCNHPAHENGRAAIEIFAELKIEICQPVPRSAAKRRIASRQENCPTYPQNQTGRNVTPGKKRHGSETEDGPRCTRAERMESTRACVLIWRESSDGENALTKSRPGDIRNRA